MLGEAQACGAVPEAVEQSAESAKPQQEANINFVLARHDEAR